MRKETTYKAYKAHSNILTMPHLTQMNWDYKDQLLGATNGTFESYYVYDASGNRVRKVVEKGSIVEERFYLGDYELFRKTTNETLEIERSTVHVSDNQKRIAMIDNDGTTETIRYQYDNHLGSASLELDENAATISYEEYHPFGTTSYHIGNNENEVKRKRYRYVGKERDEETGLYYYGARYYAAWIGRWTATDPMAGERSWVNPYNYCQNNPINRIDPTGALDDNPPNDPINSKKTNFYIKKGDKQAEIDIKGLASKKHQRKNYITINREGAVTLSNDFNELSTKKQNKALSKDEGLKLVYDLIQAKDSSNNDAKILYQTEGGFDFSGYKETNDTPPNDWPQHTSGEVSNLKNVKQFYYGASVTAYGQDTKGNTQPTLLPKAGFDGQVAIAKGEPIIEEVKMRSKVLTNDDGTQSVQYTPYKVQHNIRKEMIIHELREMVFRVKGDNYIDAHNNTNRMYNNRGGSADIFIWN